MGNYEKEANEYLQHIAKGYEKYKKLWIKYYQERQVEFNEDILNDTIIKCYDLIKKQGIKDNTYEGAFNYTFKAFNMNSRREALYARNAYNDANVNVFDYLDNFDNGDGELEQKINLQHYNDFSVVYILKKVEKQFDIISSSCFRLYYLIDKMTYQKLKELTNVKDAKKRVLEIREWLKQNITEEEVRLSYKNYLSELEDD